MSFAPHRRRLWMASLWIRDPDAGFQGQTCVCCRVAMTTRLEVGGGRGGVSAHVPSPLPDGV